MAAHPLHAFDGEIDRRANGQAALATRGLRSRVDGVEAMRPDREVSAVHRQESRMIAFEQLLSVQARPLEADERRPTAAPMAPPTAD